MQLTVKNDGTEVIKVTKPEMTKLVACRAVLKTAKRCSIEEAGPALDAIEKVIEKLSAADKPKGKPPK